MNNHINAVTPTAIPSSTPIIPIDESKLAFWELDNNITGNKLNTWVQKQLYIAVNESIIKNHNNTTTNNEVNNAISKVLYHNLWTSISALKIITAPIDATKTDDDDDDDDNSDDNNDNNNRNNNNNNQRNKKKRRKKLKRTIRLLNDPYKIWFQMVDDSDDSNTDNNHKDNTNNNNIWNEQQDDIPEASGGKLAALSIGGILNALCAISSTHHPETITPTPPGGICHATIPNIKALKKYMSLHPYIMQSIISTIAITDNSIISITLLYDIATHFHQAVADQIKLDILQTTPLRIQNLLAGDLTNIEFANVRKRVYDTVILGKGMGKDGNNNGGIDGDDTKDIPTASTALSLAVHDIEKFKKCMTCNNNNQNDFILDRKNGDVICNNCGTVVSESLMHEGSQFRKFEGEIDRNHHGDTANPLYSNAHNMSTSLSGVQPTTGAGISGWGAGISNNKRNLETILRNAHDYTELNVSQFGKNDRRTRIGYKDRQKKDAFIQLNHTGDSLNLNEAVVQRAKEIFAGFRDDRELIQQLKAVLAACLCEAFEQLSIEGRILLRNQTQNQQHQQQPNSKSSIKDKNDVDNGDSNTTESNKPMMISSKASRRKELHHVKLAGKGGLSLNKIDDDKNENNNNNNEVTNNNTNDDDDDDNNHENKKPPAATWNLEDCRTWLLEASLRIAENWIIERKKDTIDAKKYPMIPDDELKGQLVENAITLCEYLETEYNNQASNNNANNKSTITTKPTTAAAANHKRMRVVTPRVNDMTKLGIKWQHDPLDLGSGNNKNKNGTTTATTSNNNKKKTFTTNSLRMNSQQQQKLQNSHHRTAGQILLLKTSQKLSIILNNDILAGDAFHKELRILIDKQSERKRLAQRVEASKQRLHQMQRKPWLQARIQQND